MGLCSPLHRNKYRSQKIVKLNNVNLNKNFRFIRFCFVGGVGFFFSLLLMVTCVELFSFSYLWGTALTWACGNLLTFYLNKSFTFRRKGTPWGIEMIKYFFIMGSNFFLSIALMYILVDVYKINYIVASICLAITLMSLNYLAHAVWSFK